MSSLGIRRILGVFLAVVLLSMSVIWWADRPEVWSSSVAVDAAEQGDSELASGATDSETGSDRSDAPAGHRVLRIVDPCGGPIEGARVTSIAPAVEGEELIVTAADGTCRLRSTGSSGVSIEIEHSGAVQALQLSQHVPRTVPEELVLGHTSIQGRVTGPEFTLESAMVYVWPIDASPDMEGLKRGTARGLHAVSGDGSFQVCQLKPDERYQLVAGGDGWCSERVAAPVAPGSVIELPIRPVFGALIRFREVSGRPARISDALFVSAGMGLRGARVGSKLSYESPQAYLLGLPPSALTPQPHEQLKLLFADDGDSVLGPFPAQAEYPGYQQVQFDWVATPVEEGISIHDIALSQTGDGFGSIRIDCTGIGPQACAPPRTSLPVLCLRLLDRETGRELNFSLPSELSNTLTLDAIPCGVYQAKVRSLTRVFSSPSSEVEVRAGAESELTVDFSGLACIQVEISHRDQPYGGPARVSIHLPVGAEAQGIPGVPDGTPLMREAMSSFAGPPYVVPFLPVGSYEVSVSIPGVGRSERQSVRCDDTNVSRARFLVP